MELPKGNTMTVKLLPPKGPKPTGKPPVGAPPKGLPLPAKS